MPDKRQYCRKDKRCVNWLVWSAVVKWICLRLCSDGLTKRLPFRTNRRVVHVVLYTCVHGRISRTFNLLYSASHAECRYVHVACMSRARADATLACRARCHPCRGLQRPLRPHAFHGPFLGHGGLRGPSASCPSSSHWSLCTARGIA